MSATAEGECRPTQRLPPEVWVLVTADAVIALGYGVARVICEMFREPDVQLGFLWGGLTMGMILCVPLMLGGIAILTYALSRDPKPEHG